MEVTVNFICKDINHLDSFYTDSNGLEMQERILNYRQTWDFSTTDSITSNYYPVNTAIVIRDFSKQGDVQNQMTDMNSRPQGGSVLKKGRIELMHNRRLYFDDHRGMGEPLNETDEFGKGITVTSNYYLQLFNRVKEPSL